MYRFYLAAVDMLPGALILIPVYLLLNSVNANMYLSHFSGK